MDYIDRKIIEELQKNGRAKYRTLAKELGISPSCVSRRVAQLIRKGAIRIVAVQPDPEQAGHGTIATLGLNIERGKIDDVCAELVVFDSVVFAGVAYGRFDAILSVYVDSPKTLLDLIKNEISKIEGIENIETFYIAEVKKRTPLAPPHPSS